MVSVNFICKSKKSRSLNSSKPEASSDNSESWQAINLTVPVDERDCT